MPILDGNDAAAVEAACDLIAQGALVAFATETVYGLGARADDDAAVARIFATKGRPAGHPLIVHVGQAQQAQAFAEAWPPVAQRLVDAFWPGPLTVIVRRRAGMADAAAGHQPTIGLRSPSHPVARALLQGAFERGVPGIAAPSANRFGHVSPTRAEHVRDEFGDELAVLDGGACDAGIESTIVDCSRGRPVLLRPGVIARAAIEAAAGEPLHQPDTASPRASGTLASHYAPRARLRLMPSAQLAAAIEVIGPAGGKARGLAVYSRSVAVPAAMRQRRMPDDAAGAAHDLYAALRELDAEGVDLIWVEAPPQTPAWEGVRDRLQRAAA